MNFNYNYYNAIKFIKLKLFFFKIKQIKYKILQGRFDETLLIKR